MATASLALPRLRSRTRVRAQARPRHIAIENTVMFVVAFGFYIVAAVYLVLHLNYMISDAFARIDNAFDVLFTNDPHLAAIGFFWPPLPSFLEIPIIAFRNLWPPLVTQGFAGSIEAAAFSAGTVVLFNSGLRWAGVVRGMRWIICLLFLINPMIILFAVQGMAEAPFIFFFVAAILVYLRWTESRRTALLPLIGVLAGLDCLCRDEAFVFALFLGVAVVVQCVRNRASIREIETKALLFGLPAIFMVMLWLGSAAIIMHDPLYLAHASASASANGVSRAAGYALVHTNTWGETLNLVYGHSVLLFPGVIVFLVLLGARVLVKRNRIPGIMLVLFGLSTALVDTYLLHFAALGDNLRYQISVIPFTFLIAVFVLRSLRSSKAVVSSWVSLAMAGVLGISNVLCAQLLMDPEIGREQQPAIVAAITNSPITYDSGFPDAMAAGPTLSREVVALDTDNGHILCDSATCFPIVLTAPNPKLFVVTSDRDFEAAAAQPLVYHVEYFLVPAPAYIGAFDQLNILYPTLYAGGGGFATLVGTVGDGRQIGTYRLYRITGPTGRG